MLYHYTMRCANSSGLDYIKCATDIIHYHTDGQSGRHVELYSGGDCQSLEYQS